MGQSSSVEQLSPEQREVESLAASTGALPSLQKVFATLSDPQTNSIPLHSLQKCFGFSFKGSTSEESKLPKEFPVLLSHLSSSIADLFFLSEKGGISWIEFLKGYTKCSGRTVGSASLNNLLRLFGTVSVKAGLQEKLQVVSDEDDSKISGFLLPVDVQMLLYMCWIMWWDSKKLKASGSLGDSGLPDVTHLVLSAVDSCTEADKKLDLWEDNILDMDIQLPAAKIVMWALKTVPSLADCLGQFIHARLCYIATHEEQLEQADIFSHDISSREMSISSLLTCGRAWPISLTLRSTISEEISKACFPSAAAEVEDYLLYRSSLHGKGLNRFWSNVEGYNGPLLILLSAHEVNNDSKRWIIGVLVHHGLENQDTFYGTSSSLYSISPVFHVFPPSGKEKNFVYSHLHTTVKKYEAHPKPVGLAFGGSSGNERISIDEDFAKVTVRHHACDKTYQHGPLFPVQGFLPVEASITNVEVLGLGGKRCREIQLSYKKREELFTEQRRKVDLNTFGNWEDSPEKMMMDMVTNPNSVRREER